MHQALTLAAATAVLKHLLENQLIEQQVAAALGTDVSVSSLSPDRIPTGADERAQLNLFLYRVKPRLELRVPGAEGAPKALSVDLHYLLTTYGPLELQPELLLGSAADILSKSPVLDRSAIQQALRVVAGAPTAPGVLGALRATNFDSGIDHLKIQAQFLEAEELARLWSALQTRYRLSLGYLVTVGTRPEA